MINANQIKPNTPIAVSRSRRDEKPRWKRGSEVVDLTRA
jgi:hypothetical protein